MRVGDALCFYHLKEWGRKTGARPLLYVFFGYAVAGGGRWESLLLNGLAALGVFMFAAAFDDYWDYRIRDERNFLAEQIKAGHLNPTSALWLSCAPLLLSVPFFWAAPALRFPLMPVTLMFIAAVALLLGYSLPPLRLKDARLYGFFVGPLLACVLFLESVLIVKPLSLFLGFLALLLFGFQCYAEAIHVVDNVSHGRVIRTLSIARAQWLVRVLPLTSCIVSLGLATHFPVLLVTSVCSLLRWLTIRRLSTVQIHAQRRHLLSPMWALYEFVVYAGFGICGVLPP